jgi:hypothetical protein
MCLLPGKWLVIIHIHIFTQQFHWLRHTMVYIYICTVNIYIYLRISGFRHILIYIYIYITVQRGRGWYHGKTILVNFTILLQGVIFSLLVMGSSPFMGLIHLMFWLGFLNPYFGRRSFTLVLRFICPCLGLGVIHLLLWPLPLSGSLLSRVASSLG